MFRTAHTMARRRASVAFVVATVFAMRIPATLAQDGTAPADEELPRIIVSATRVPTPEDEVASSVTLITAADIDAQQARTLPDVLQSVPGLNVVQTGGPGGQTSIFMRGTNSNHVKFFVDGIDVSDPSTPTDTFDLEHLLLADIDRIEVLRGPQSGLFGFLFRLGGSQGSLFRLFFGRGRSQSRRLGVRGAERLPGGNRGSCQQSNGDHCRGNHGRSISPDELLELVGR